MPLTAQELPKKPVGKHSDGSGLLFRVTTRGTRDWFLRVDRVIEPAYAQSCPSIEKIRSGNNRVINTLMDCNFEIMRVQNRN